MIFLYTFLCLILFILLFIPGFVSNKYLSQKKLFQVPDLFLPGYTRKCTNQPRITYDKRREEERGYTDDGEKIEYIGDKPVTKQTAFNVGLLEKNIKTGEIQRNLIF